MTDKNRHAQTERPRKRQRTKDPSDTENVSGTTINDPIRRATRACDQCRSQKKRCDSGHPCLACAKASLDCHYGKQARKRGFPTGYVRIIEALWALVFKAVPESEETALQLLRHSKIGLDDEGKVTLINFHFDQVDSSRKAWLDSSTRREIERLASELENGGGSSSAPEQQSTSSSDPAATKASVSSVPPNLATWTIPGDALSGIVISSHRNNVAPPEGHVSDSRPPANEPHNSVPQIGDPALFPADAWSLTETYFKYVNSWLPITPKYSIIRALTEVQDGAACRPSQLGMLSAIFALASSQQLGSDENVSSISEKYYLQAIETIPSDVKELETGHAQALVQLTVLNMARGHWEGASRVLRGTIRTIIQLQRSYRRQRGSLAGMEPALSRTILAAFALDTLLAACSGTIPQLRSRDVSWAAQYDENEADEWEQWAPPDTAIQPGAAIPPRPLRSLSVFKQYVNLLSILNDSLCDLRPAHDLEAKMNAYRSRLVSWKTALPKHCQYPTTTNGTMEARLDVSPSVANLHLTAEAVSRFLLERPRGSNTLSSYEVTTQASGIADDTSSSVYKTVYHAAFGSAAWRGILDFHDYANRLLSDHQGVSSGTISSQRGISFDTRPLPFAYSDNNVAHNLTTPGQFNHMSPEMLNSVLSADVSPVGNFLDHHHNSSLPHHSLAGAPFLDGLDTIMTEQVSSTGRLDQQNGPQFMDTSSSGAALTPFDLGQLMPSATSGPGGGQVFNDVGDEGSIETLLEELSAQQNVSWDDMEAQTMYNLGFMPGDHLVR